MPKLTIDGTEIEVENGLSVLQACEIAGAEIPRFCYHERLSIAGNCRMCLVEMERSPKPIASCAMPAADGMVIMTNTETVKKAREGVMEFLLINHPLDCPICDQGGECDLQDQAMAYGVDKTRFGENKRAVEDKDIGPLVKTTMTRCIHCTRCVRFATEVGGVEELGAIGRGEDMEITTYLEGAMSSELSGNVIDLCPVGALTSKPYAFSARPWELKKTETIDVMDAIGAHIRVDTRGREVMRIQPRVNEDINEEWISDKSRFIWDGLKTQRLDTPFIRNGQGRLQPASWDQAFDKIARHLKGKDPRRIGAIAGDLASAEEMFALKDLFNRLGSHNLDCRQEGGSGFDPALGRASYIFNSTIAAIEEADALLLIGANPRLEASVLNTRIRKRSRADAFPVGVIGGVPDGKYDLTYDYNYLGAGPETLSELADDKNTFAKQLSQAERPMIIVGTGVLARKDGRPLLSQAAKLAVACGAVSNDWNGFNVLNTAAARVAGLDLGFVPGKQGLDIESMLAACAKGAFDAVFLLGADEADFSQLKDVFTIYQGSHGDRGAERADVILPGAAYTEKSGTYVNLEGRVQQARRAGFPPGEAREDWAILRALSERLGQTLPYDNLGQLRHALYEAHPHLAKIDGIDAGDISDIKALAKLGGRVNNAPFISGIGDFYMTNPIARASAIMAECSVLAHSMTAKGTGTDG